LPHVPIAKDTLPDFEVVNWYAMSVRAGTSAEIVTRLSAEVAAALRQPDVAERAAALGLELVGSTPEQFGALQRSEIVKWGNVVRTVKIQME